MSVETTGLIVAIVSAISALIAAVVAAIGLFRLRKVEELRILETMNRDIGRGFKEHNLLQAESPKDDREEAVQLGKLRALYLNSYDDINWLCYLIRHGQIGDQRLVNAFRGQIITWYIMFQEALPDKVLKEGSYTEFKNLYQDFINGRPPKITDQKHLCIYKLKKIFNVS